MDMTNHLYPVILAGGSGTRFWPLSRHLYPKQLLRIIGDETLIQQTMRRVLSCARPARVACTAGCNTAPVRSALAAALLIRLCCTDVARLWKACSVLR